jgi:hypothetical protein
VGVLNSRLVEGIASIFSEFLLDLTSLNAASFAEIHQTKPLD